ncbi:MAG: hypothetical protein NTW25_13100 [Candidatus Kapabacteria bacterium]|nr:hypothetical protein [Candidatus Kapabacteria bacterium]
MELLDKLVIPVSEPHLNLLRILLILAMVLFLSYSSLLYGTTILSVYYNRMFKKSNDSKFNLLSKDLIETLTQAPTIWFGMGIAPLIGVILLYTQLLHGTTNSVLAYMVVSLVFFCIGTATIYIYKKSLILSGVLNKVKSNDSKLIEYEEENNNDNGALALWSFVFLTLSNLFFIASLNLATDSRLWDSGVFPILFSSAAQFKFLFFVVFGIVFTGITFLYVNFSFEGGKHFDDSNYVSFVKDRISKIALSASYALPFLLAMTIISTPINALNGNLFIYAALTCFFIVISAQLLYSYIKESKNSNISLGFWFLFLAFTFYITKEQSAFATTSQNNLMRLASIHEKLELESSSKEVKPVEINPQEIFNAKCIACHKFDIKQTTAPAYNDVAVKYIGNEGDMVKFILNPVPKNAKDFPSGMPNQGLKPAEAKAMATWIIAQVKKNKGL